MTTFTLKYIYWRIDTTIVMKLNKFLINFTCHFRHPPYNNPHLLASLLRHILLSLQSFSLLKLSLFYNLICIYRNPSICSKLHIFLNSDQSFLCRNLFSVIPSRSTKNLHFQQTFSEFFSTSSINYNMLDGFYGYFFGSEDVNDNNTKVSTVNFFRSTWTQMIIAVHLPDYLWLSCLLWKSILCKLVPQFSSFSEFLTGSSGKLLGLVLWKKL